MQQVQFSKEYEIRASPKILYPYVSSASGLGAWFADKATVDPSKQIYNFVWDNTDHKAKLSLQKLNKLARFDFESEEDGKAAEPFYIEFRLDTNELTQMVFLKITDCTLSSDPDELEELWDSLVATLREKVGG